MKIIQINTFSYKAAGNIMLNLHRTMLDSGIDSYVVWGRGRETENFREYFMNDDFGVKIHGIYTRITDKTGFASKKATNKLIKWIDNIKPDIIHLHCIHGYYINIELLFNYIKANKIKVIWTQHDCWAFTGHCAYFDAVGCTKWKDGCFDCEQLNTYPASIIKDNSMWNWEKKKELFSDVNMTIVTPCNWLARITKKSFLKEYPIEVIYNGIDDNVFRYLKSDFKTKYNIDDKKIILGVASEWTERKGLRDFIQLNNLIDKKIYKIVIVGVNKKQKRTLPSDIIAIERTENIEKLVQIYSAAYVYYNPTYEDNFPTTNLEALSCGTPVITYETGGSIEPIDQNGYIIKTGNINEVEKKLDEVNNLKEITLKDIFKKETMIKEYVSLYKRIINYEG